MFRGKTLREVAWTWIHYHTAVYACCFQQVA